MMVLILNDDIAFIKDTKLYVTVVTLSEKKQLQMFERSMYWNEYNAKNENENTTNEYRYFLESFL